MSKTHPAIHEVTQILTPFGIANVRRFDSLRDMIHTDKGSWALEEIRPIQAEDYDIKDPKSLEMWFDGPQWEATTTHYLRPTPCDCKCGCEVVVTHLKLDNQPIHGRHQHAGTCICEINNCTCLAKAAV